jgi:hypothetical protein
MVICLSDMTGLINKAIKWGINKGKSVNVIQRYLRIKHKIIVGKNALLKRINRYTNQS